MTQTATATIDRAAIMQDAWAMYRRFHHHVAFCAQRFGSELRRAWHKAKMAIANACPIHRTRNAILALESKNHLTQQDHARLGVLRAALRAKQEAAQAHDEAAPAYAEKRQLIEAAGGRFCAVTFTKKDGTKRVMQVQPATLKNHVKGDAATDAGKRAVATVSRIAVDGTVHEYA